MSELNKTGVGYKTKRKKTNCDKMYLEESNKALYIRIDQ